MSQPRQLAGFIAPMCLAAILAVPVPAAAVTVSVAPAETTISVPSQDFYVRVEITAFADLKAYELIYQFDPSVIQFLDAEPGDVMTSLGPGDYVSFTRADTPPPDSVWFDVAALQGSASGPGILAFFHFRSLAVGTTTLHCELADLRDSQNHQTIPDCDSGIVHVMDVTPALPTTWGRLKTRYR